MAKLCLNYEKTTLKEFPLSMGVVTIGRLPDNDIQIDNPAVSGHHATVHWETGQFILEDKRSFNGTFVNDHRVMRQALKDNDVVLVGKHTLVFKAEASQPVAPAMGGHAKLAVPSLDATAMLDTKKARELMAQAAGKGGAAEAAAPAAAKRLGVLTVMQGKTDQTSYVLTSKLTVIGKSAMASIRLKGWFAPAVAANINHRDDKYFLAPADRKQKVKVNGQPIVMQCELNEGDTVQVGKVVMSFSFTG